MNSFTLTAVGNLARNPELVSKADKSYTKLCLVGNDYAGKDEEGAAREVTTSLWFVAFGAMGEAIARNALKGDQLILEARVRESNWTDEKGEKQYDHSFIVRQHYESLTVGEKPSTTPHRMVLVDDVISKGRTLLAAAARLRCEFPHADVRAFAMVRTMGFLSRVDRLIAPCEGHVYWMRGDARREP